MASGGAAMRLALIFNRHRPDATGIYFERACRALGVSCDHWWLRDAERIPGGYDLYLRIDHGDDYLVRLPSRLRPAVFYAIDTHLKHTWKKVRATAAWYDLVCCAQRAAVRRLPRAAWVPLGCDLELHGPTGEPIGWDLAFVGTEGGVPRKFYLQALRERYPNSFLGTADHAAIGSVYSRARIGFNYAVADDVNMRVFEVLASGALLMTNALSHGDLEALGLQDRQHLVLYRTPQELLDALDRYLRDTTDRVKIARAGSHVAQERHTYRHRLQQLLAVVQQAGLTRPVSAAAAVTGRAREGA